MFPRGENKPQHLQYLVFSYFISYERFRVLSESWALYTFYTWLFNYMLIVIRSQFTEGRFDMLACMLIWEELPAEETISSPLRIHSFSFSGADYHGKVIRYSMFLPIIVGFPLPHCEHLSWALFCSLARATINHSKFARKRWLLLLKCCVVSARHLSSNFSSTWWTWNLTKSPTTQS